ncbi:MAG TPA: universal stress protein [Chitinophagaceae bacterium]|nr:universal stress protein [Chitinophagaceae bacterium]
MTNILIPTDFTAASLKMTELFIRDASIRKCNIVLFHAFRLPLSPFDLLAARTQDPACALVSEPFRQACKQLKDAFPGRVGKIVIRCMTGDTPALFRNFIDAHNIDLVYCPDTYRFAPVHPRSIDPCPLFKKCGIPVVRSARKEAGAGFVETVLQNIQMSTA